jgi:hypothetical protein
MCIIVYLVKIGKRHCLVNNSALACQNQLEAALDREAHMIDQNCPEADLFSFCSQHLTRCTEKLEDEEVSHSS